MTHTRRQPHKNKDLDWWNKWNTINIWNKKLPSDNKNWEIKNDVVQYICNPGINECFFKSTVRR